MRGMGRWIACLAVAAATGCGQGHVMFNVDALSFLRPSGDDNIPYDLPGGFTADSSVAQFFALPGGLGKSTINTVSITAAAALVNATGGGNMVFDVFFSKKQAGLFTGTPYVSAASGPVSGVDSVPLLPPTTVSPGDTVFNSDSVWVGIRAHLTSNPPLLPHMTGRLRLTELSVHIVINDKLF